MEAHEEGKKMDNAHHGLGNTVAHLKQAISHVNPVHITLPDAHLKSLWNESAFRHPVSRLVVAFSIIFVNFFIYAEDPVAHSQSECLLPILGNAYSLLFIRYPPTVGLAIGKALFAIAFTVAGMWFGSQVLHKRVLSHRLEMFHGDKGSWMVMFWSTTVSIFLGSIAYNLVAAAAMSQEQFQTYRLTSYMGMRNESFMKAAAMGTWMGDSLTAFMVLDMILQDSAHYPHWGVAARRAWRTSLGGKGRILCFWVYIIVGTAVVGTVILAPTSLAWDNFNGDWWFRTSELSRGWIAGLITLLDICILMQDWEFPDFRTNQEVKLPGVGVASLHCRLTPDVQLKVTGKWFNYGIILMVMCLDFNMLKNQILYSPAAYGQYTDADGRIYTVTDPDTLARALLPASDTYNTSLVSFAARQMPTPLLLPPLPPLPSPTPAVPANTTSLAPAPAPSPPHLTANVTGNMTGSGSNVTMVVLGAADPRMNARFRALPLPLKAMTLLPALGGVAVLLYVVRRNKREKTHMRRQSMLEGDIETAAAAAASAGVTRGGGTAAAANGTGAQPFSTTQHQHGSGGGGGSGVQATSQHLSVHALPAPDKHYYGHAHASNTPAATAAAAAAAAAADGGQPSSGQGGNRVVPAAALPPSADDASPSATTATVLSPPRRNQVAPAPAPPPS